MCSAVPACGLSLCDAYAEAVPSATAGTVGIGNFSSSVPDELGGMGEASHRTCCLQAASHSQRDRAFERPLCALRVRDKYM